MILDAIQKRVSGRAYDERPVSEDLVTAILEAGRIAPSCANTQAWNFIVIKDHEVRMKADDAMSGGNYWSRRAPVMIIVAAETDGGCGAHGLPYFMMDMGLAIENMLLQAVHMGLMGHPTAGWDEDKLRSVIELPPKYRIGAVLFFGYAYEGDPDFLGDKHRKQEKEGRIRRPIDEIVHWNQW